MLISPAVLAGAGFLLAFLSALIGAGVAWGAHKSDASTLREKVSRLETKIDAMAEQILRLVVDVRVITDRSEREPTGPHRSSSR